MTERERGVRDTCDPRGGVAADRSGGRRARRSTRPPRTGSTPRDDYAETIAFRRPGYTYTRGYGNPTVEAFERADRRARGDRVRVRVRERDGGDPHRRDVARAAPAIGSSPGSAALRRRVLAVHEGAAALRGRRRSGRSARPRRGRRRRCPARVSCTSRRSRTPRCRWRISPRWALRPRRPGFRPRWTTRSRRRTCATRPRSDSPT